MKSCQRIPNLKKTAFKAILIFFQAVFLNQMAFPIGAEELSPNKIPISEVYNKIPVSGGICKGIMYGNMDLPADISKLSAYVPAGKWKELKVEIISQDGMYYAEMVYDISNGPVGMQSLKFPTQIGDKINKYKASQLAIYASISGESGNETVPAGWQRKENIDNITILINVGVDEDTKIKIEPSGAILKGVLLQGSTISYNRIFTFSVPLKVNAIKATVFRTRGFTSFRPIKLKIPVL